MENQEDNKTISIWMLVVSVVATAVLVGGVVYFGQQNIIKQVSEENQKSKAEIASLMDQIEQIQQIGLNRQQQVVSSEPGDWPEYINDDYGFGLSFPETWKGYLIREQDNFIDFGFENQNPVLRVSIIGQEQWEAIRAQGDTQLTYIGESEDSVFVYSVVLNPVNEEIESVIDDIPDIMETLELTEGELVKKDYLEEGDEEEEIEDFTYTNETYGFSLTFPGTWDNYQVKNRTLDWGENGESDSIDFGFADQDSLFNISILTKSQWENIQLEEGTKPSYLWEGDEYVFAYSKAQDAVNDIMTERMEEILNIISTFELNEE